MPDLIEANRAINDVYKHVGARISKVRRAAGLNQADLGTAVGLSRSSIANVESGVQRPPLHVYLAIAQGFGLSLAELLGDAELPAIADRVPTGGALVVKRARQALVDTAERLAELAEKLEGFDA